MAKPVGNAPVADRVLREHRMDRGQRSVLAEHAARALGGLSTPPATTGPTSAPMGERIAGRPSASSPMTSVSVVAQARPVVGLTAMAIALIGRAGSSRPSAVKRRISLR